MVRIRSGVVLLVLGACLLALSIAGRWTAIGRYTSFPPRTWERFDPALAEATPDVGSLYSAAQARASQPLPKMPPAEAMGILHETVEDRFTHGDRATYSPFSNWILWALSAANRRYRDIQDPDILLRGGHSALCGDVSYVLMRLAGMAGIPARHVLLDGHIVMEAWFGGTWHAYDPDLEVAALDNDDRVVLSTETLAGRQDLVRKFYSGRGGPAFTETVLAIYTSAAGIRYLAYPAPGGVAKFLTPGQRPGRVERAAHAAVFLVPSGMIMVGGALVAGRRRTRHSCGRPASPRFLC